MHTYTRHIYKLGVILQSKKRNKAKTKMKGARRLALTKTMFNNKMITQISRTADIVQLIGRRVDLHKRGSLYYGLCPFHKEGRASFTVDPHDQTFHCYGCGRGGNVFSYVMLAYDCSFECAVELLATYEDLSVPTNADEPEHATLLWRMYQANELACEYFYQKGKGDPNTMRYLKEERKLTDDIIEEFRLGYSGPYGNELYRLLHSNGYTDEEILASGLAKRSEEDGKLYDKFWNRVMFPIMNTQHKIVGFGGRAFGDSKPKYINSNESAVFDKGHELFGLSLTNAKKKPFVLCEGYLDVITMHRAGFKTAVASLGTALTYSQARLLKDYTDTVFIAYDSDEAGVKAATRAIPILRSVGLKIKVVSVAPYKDVDELLKADDKNFSNMKKRMKEAKEANAFLLEQWQKDPTVNVYEKITELL